MHSISSYNIPGLPAWVRLAIRHHARTEGVSPGDVVAAMAARCLPPHVQQFARAHAAMIRDTAGEPRSRRERTRPQLLAYLRAEHGCPDPRLPARRRTPIAPTPRVRLAGDPKPGVHLAPDDD